MIRQRSRSGRAAFTTPALVTCLYLYFMRHRVQVRLCGR